MKNLLVALALLAPFIFGSIAFAYNVETEPQNVNQENKTSEFIVDAALKTQDIDLTVPGQVLHIYKAMKAAETSNTQLDGTSKAAAAKTKENVELPITQKEIMMSSLPENSMVETMNAEEINDSFNSMIEASYTEEAAVNTVSSPAVEFTNTLEKTSTDYESDALETANDVIEESDKTGESAVDTEERTADDVAEPQPAQEENQFDAGDFTENELDLLARLVRAEAQTEPLEGKIAVACVVLNRVKSSQFPDTIKEVIYQPRQFQPVSNNQINKPADTESIEAVQAALSDHQHIAEDSLFFYNPDIATSRWLDSRETTVVIGQHVFKK